MVISIRTPKREKDGRSGRPPTVLVYFKYTNTGRVGENRKQTTKTLIYVPLSIGNREQNNTIWKTGVLDCKTNKTFKTDTMTNNSVVDIDFGFNEHPKLEEIQWSILVGKENDRVRIIEHPDKEMLFPGVNAGLLYSVYPTVKRYKNPNEVELTVRAAYTKGKAAGPDWNSIAGWIKATGTITDEERTVSRGANNPQEQVAEKS